jgi:hypothetical protein
VRFPPIDNELGKLVKLVTESVLGEICNNLIFLRPDDCHSHYHDALEAYLNAGGDYDEVTDFTEMVLSIGFDKAVKRSPLWSAGSIRYAQALFTCCMDPLAMFILMPANEALAPAVYTRALASLTREPRFGMFRLFLERHVELDRSSHGPIALEWLETYLNMARPELSLVASATEKVITYFSGGNRNL